MKRYLPLFVVFLLHIASAQKVDIRGVVSDSVSGEKIPYATVTILGTNRGAATNNNGFYLIAGVPWGSYDIVATSLGYLPKKITVNVRGTAPISVQFPLIAQPVEVNEVLVMGGRKSELTEINTGTHILSQEEIKQIPTAAQGDLLRALQILPGIVSSADVTSKFYVRGGAGDQNLILFDGMKIYNPFHAFGMFSIFDPDIVRTTEVHTGSFPAGYGGKLSSVINIQSQDGHTAGVHGAADLNFLSGKLLLKGPITENNSWIISGRKSLFSETYDKFLKDPPPISFYDIFAKAKFGGGEYGRYSANVFISRDDIIASNPNEADHQWNTESFAFKISDLIQERAYFESVIYSSNFAITRQAGSSAIVRPATAAINDFGIRTDITLYTESTDLYFVGFDVSGLSYRYEFTAPSNLVTAVDDAAIEIASWFRYQMTVGRLKGDFGVHSDVMSLLSGKDFTSSLQPRIGMSVLFYEDWRFKISFGIYTQGLISLSNEDDVISLFEAWVYVPENVDRQKALHYSAGIEGNLFAELSASLQGYYKDYTSLILYNRNKQFAVDPDFVNGNGEAYGIETLLRYKYEFIDLYLSYTLGWTSVTSAGLTYAPRYDRRHSANILNITRVTDQLDIAVRWEFGTGYPFSQTTGIYNRLSIADLGRGSFVNDQGTPYTVLGPKNSARLPSYHRLDVTATYRILFGDVTGKFGLNVVNVYDHRNILYYDRKTLQTITMLPLLPTAFINIEF